MSAAHGRQAVKVDRREAAEPRRETGCIGSAGDRTADGEASL